LIVFELEEKVSSLSHNLLHALKLTVQRIGGDRGSRQIAHLVKVFGCGEFPFDFGFLGFGFFGGNGHDHRGTAFVFAQGEGEHKVAHKKSENPLWENLACLDCSNNDTGWVRLKRFIARPASQGKFPLVSIKNRSRSSF